MVKKYYINNVTQDWLLKPGIVIYIEREYDELINNYIKKNLTHLQKLCEKQGCLFLYIPKFYTSLPDNILKYYTGKELEYSTKIHTYDIINSIFSNLVLCQIQEPSLLFTGSSDNKCIAFSIGHDTSLFSKFFPSRKEKYIENRINQILSDIRSVYGGALPKVEKQLFYDETDGSALKERISYTSDSGTRFRVSGKVSGRIEQVEELDEDEDFKSSACEQAQNFVARLLQKGYSKEAIWALLAPMKELSPIKVTRDFRILLPLYDMEIKLPPVQKAVYLLFLIHLEGISFKDMPDYQNELFLIYRKIAIRGMKQKHLETITDLVNPLSNSMNEKCSIIKKRITALLDDDLAKHYYISGGRAESKKIDIRPTLVIWE